jgi:hypothetical protein
MSRFKTDTNFYIKQLKQKKNKKKQKISNTYLKD